MKQKLSFLLCVLLFSFALGQTATPPENGNGTAGDPYQIETLENLYWYCINYGGYASQTQHINAAQTSTWNDGAGWPTIGSGNTYSGTYDGQGYTIDSLYINNASALYMGFVGQGLGATVKNLGLTNANITGGEKTGGIIANGSNLTVENCYVTGSISGANDVGGIIGSANNNGAGYIQSCYSSASVSGTYYVGGILGNGRCNIINSYANGSSSAGVFSGGLAGYVWQSTIMNCYSAAVVVNGGGLVGDSDAGGEAGSTALNSYWDTEASGQAMSELGTGYPTEIMKIQAAYSSWDFETTWAINGETNDGYPYLQSMVPTEMALPIALTQFNVEFEKGVVNIFWRTESETDNARFLIYRNDEIIASINGAGTTSECHRYAYQDNDIIPGRSYTYILADISYANELIKHEDMAVTIVLSENDVTPSYELGDNYPNPFNPSTQIPVTLSVESDIRLDIYDMSGKLIRNLINASMPAGYHEIMWDGRDNNGKEANTGMYITTLSNGDFYKSHKMLLIK